MIIKKIVDKIVGKKGKFFPVVNENGNFEIVEKPRKFIPITEIEYLIEQRKKGCYGNGRCVDKF